MQKRTRNKLTIYRRHAGSCPVKDSSKLDDCDCPFWVHGKIRGEFIRESMQTRSKVAATMKQADMLEGHSRRGPDDPTPGGGMALISAKTRPEEVSLELAEQAFGDYNRRKSKATRRVYAKALAHFIAWATANNLTLVRQIDKAHIRAYFAAYDSGWTQNTSQGRLTRLRVFFNFCKSDRHWIPFSPAFGRDLNYQRSSKRLPFNPDEVTRILAAVERMPEEDRDRARALVMLLLYSGVRISDATFFEREYLSAKNYARYWIIKTRTQLELALEMQKPALDALAKLPPSRTYFFQPDVEDDYAEARLALRSKGDFAAVMPGYRGRVAAMTRLVEAVLTLAGLKGTCHRFRDTFAVSLLVNGVDVFSVSQYLGHSDVKITQKHYIKLVDGYSERMSQKTRALAYVFPAA